MYPSFTSRSSRFSRLRWSGTLSAVLLLPLVTGLQAQELPVITPAGGYFLDSITVTITSPVPDAEIRYSVERNQQPSPQSPLYTRPFPLKKTSRVSARLFRNGQPLGNAVETVRRITTSDLVHRVHSWKEQPPKAALMLTFAHADDRPGATRHRAGLAAEKLYAHIGIRDQIEFDWSIRYPELSGKTPVEVAREAMNSSYLTQFVSQPQGERQPGGPKEQDPKRLVYGVRYGLLNTRVGSDLRKNDFFEHIDMSAFGK